VPQMVLYDTEFMYLISYYGVRWKVCRWFW